MKQNCTVGQLTGVRLEPNEFLLVLEINARKDDRINRLERIVANVREMTLKCSPEEIQEYIDVALSNLEKDQQSAADVGVVEKRSA